LSTKFGLTFLGFFFSKLDFEAFHIVQCIVLNVGLFAVAGIGVLENGAQPNVKPDRL
jgi:hypothetical protein